MFENIMAKDNSTYRFKLDLDVRAESYSECVFKRFDYNRQIGKKPEFGSHYYPAMVVTCQDSMRIKTCDSYARKSDIGEYELTKMAIAIAQDFQLSPPLSYKDLNHASHHRHPIGQCAEQHAANELLFDMQKTNQDYYNQLDIKRNIYFSKAIRPATGEVFEYCDNCKQLFNL